MPSDETARLTRQESADILAYMLQAGKFPSGRVELVMDDAALKGLDFPVRTGSPAKPPAVAATAAFLPPRECGPGDARHSFPQLPILFSRRRLSIPVKKPPIESGTGGFDWFTWGSGVYRGWDVVDYAAVSLAESATLMLTAGRRCENGRLVPVSDPDWIKFSLELAEAGKAAYKASQTRNQDTISESTNQLNDSCMNCHRVYRGRTHCVKP
jgi:hypothetical protein